MGNNHAAGGARGWSEVLTLPVIVAALGYFVDMFALTLFGVVRQPSVAALGLSDPAEALQLGKSLYNHQMVGMMVGGLLWGLLGDHLGRLKVLFGSILLYSLGNIANAFVTTPGQYEICRLLTGVGLAGELGAAITLVAEILPRASRGLGTTVVATLGLCGAVTAALLGLMDVPWRQAYGFAGLMGLGLLLTRFKVFESGMFERSRGAAKAGGWAQLRSLLAPFGALVFSRRVGVYLACILVGAPIYFITGTLMTFAPELTQGLGIEGVSAPSALLWGTLGLTLGDFASGILSQVLRSRRRAVALCLVAALGLILVYLTVGGLTATHIYALSAAIGLCAGYWAVLVTMVAEQFGTNVRATATTTVPNFVRGSGALLVQLFVSLKGTLSTQGVALVLTAIVFGLALISLWTLKESFDTELDFTE